MAPLAEESSFSLVFGPKDIPLWSEPIGVLTDQQARQYGDQTAISFPWQRKRQTYKQLALRSKLVSKSILAAGLQHGDCVGIIAGNCHQYIETFLGSGRIGCPVVVLNNTYSPQELLNAVTHSGCKVLCMAMLIGNKSLAEHIRLLCSRKTDLIKIVLFSGSFRSDHGPEVVSYDTFISNESSFSIDDDSYQLAESQVKASDVLNLQFTSGTTGAPKAAMLTHINLINNGKLVGDGMRLTPEDIVCCPPPLFHCFGLVMGFLAAFTHGCSIVFPSDQFDANLVLDAVMNESCTALLGVPTMFVAELEANRIKKYKITTVRTGLAAGSPVPSVVMNKLESEMGIPGILIAYGMTETSPVTFMNSLDDSRQRRLQTIGTVMAHTGGKIIDKQGKIVPRGVRGEICTSGYALQKGYWKNVEKTNEVMKWDESGILWMHTGDEGIIDEEGYCAITGRIKDIIIRGGENIFPVEIEERLLAHPSVGEASVVGVPDEKYGEVVSCFLRQVKSQPRPEPSKISEWVSQTIGRHKAPKYVWWIGDLGVGDDYPKTGSGKHQKHLLRAIGQRLMENLAVRARL